MLDKFMKYPLYPFFQGELDNGDFHRQVFPLLCAAQILERNDVKFMFQDVYKETHTKKFISSVKNSSYSHKRCSNPENCIFLFFHTKRG